MFTPSKNIYTQPGILDFYSSHLEEFGDSPQGVGWKDERAQQIRFEQLLKIITTSRPFSINDLGCGAGHIIPSLNRKEFSFLYTGYDIMPKIIEVANRKYSNQNDVTFLTIGDAREMTVADYTLASGIFNVKSSNAEKDWLQYILDTLFIMNEKSQLGFAFNLLTKYSDVEFMKSELYYADPGFLFDHCKKNYSQNIALLHDYNQYDFTILVRKE